MVSGHGAKWDVFPLSLAAAELFSPDLNSLCAAGDPCGVPDARVKDASAIVHDLRLSSTPSLPSQNSPSLSVSMRANGGSFFTTITWFPVRAATPRVMPFAPFCDAILSSCERDSAEMPIEIRSRPVVHGKCWCPCARNISKLHSKTTNAL